MAGGATAEAKRKWLHEALDMPVDPSSAGPAGDDRAPIDPYADDGGDASDPEKQAEAEVDAAGKDVAAKTAAEQGAEKALTKAQGDLDAAKTNLADKTKKYYATAAKAHPAPGIDPNADLPADMLPDCAPQPGKIAGPPEHQLCKTHGHVLNIQSKQIIAHDIADYDKRHPVPRPMEADCKPDSGKLPGAPDHIVMCKPHGHVLDTKAKQVIANSGILYLKAHPGAAGKPKPAAAPAAAAPAASAGKGPVTPGGATKPGTAPAAPAGKGAAAPGDTAKPAGPKVRDGDWSVEVDKWKDLWSINIQVHVHDMHEVSYLVYWQYGHISVMPPPVAHVELNFTDGMTSKELAAPKGPVEMLIENGRYEFSGRFTLPADEASKETLGVAVRCKIVLAGSVTDELEHMSVIMLQ